MVYTVITASQWFDQIFLSDISKDNVEFLKKWIAGDANVTTEMKHQMIDNCNKEGKRSVSHNHR